MHTEFAKMLVAFVLIIISFWLSDKAGRKLKRLRRGYRRARLRTMPPTNPKPQRKEIVS